MELLGTVCVMLGTMNAILFPIAYHRQGTRITRVFTLVEVVGAVVTIVAGLLLIKGGG